MKTKLVFTAMVFLLLTFSTAGVYGQSAQAQAAYNRAIVAWNAKNYQQVIIECTEAIRLEPNYAFAYSSRGLSYEYTNDYNRAIEDFTQLIRLNPVVDHYLWRGRSYYKIRNYDNAIADCTEAIRRWPDYIEAYYYRGLAYQAKGDNARARADFEAGLRVSPDDNRFRQALASLPATPAPAQNNQALAQAASERGLAAYNQSNWDRAIAEYTEAIRLNPNSIAAYYGRGVAYTKKEDWSRAIADFTQAIRISPNEAVLYIERGSAYFNNKEFRRALDDANSALQIEPNNEKAKTLRSRAFMNS